MKEEITITVPKNAAEMTLEQLEHLLKGDVKPLLGMTDEEIMHADLDDLQKVVDAWTSIELTPEWDSKDEHFKVGSQDYLLLSPLQERTVGEMEMLEKALESSDLALLIALHTRPAVKKSTFLSKVRREGATLKRLWKVARSGPKFLPLPFDEKKCYEMADEFRKNMRGAQAITIFNYFSKLGYELAMESIRTEDSKNGYK